MIEFRAVAAEIRSLIGRRQELSTLLGSVFVAAGVFLENSIGGNLPGPLVEVERHLFGFYAAILMVPSLILALRMARLHGGLVYNGILYARALEDQDFTARGNVLRAAAHNFAGISFVQFLLADFVAGFSTAVMALATGGSPGVAVGSALAVFAACLGTYFGWHRRSSRAALRLARSAPAAPTSRHDWEAHIAASLHDANREQLGVIGFVGLMSFSVFEVLSGLGQIRDGRRVDLGLEQVERFGPPAYAVLMLVTTLMGLVAYLRIRVAIGRFSIDLDPADRPFRPFVLTDSLLGYLLIAFFLAVAVHLLAVQVRPGLGAKVLAIDGLAIVLAAAAEQATLVAAGRRYRRHGAGSEAVG